MRTLLGVLFRVATGMMVVIGFVAVVLGRAGPGPTDDARVAMRSPASPRYRGLGGYFFPHWGNLSHVVDTRTGAVLSLPMAESERFDLVDCSPWRDGHGQYHVVGRWRDFSMVGGVALARSFGLAWCTVPEGEMRDRVAIDPMPIGNPCWYPDRSGRVLYPAGGGQLHHFTFPRPDERCGDLAASPSRPGLVRWQVKPPGGGVHAIQDLHWANVPAFRGRVLASLSHLEGEAPSVATGLRLWWLDLGEDGTEVVAAGRLIPRDEAGVVADGADEERLPSVGPMRDGTAMLAYMARADSRRTWDLWVTSVPALRRLDAAGGDAIAPGLKLAEECLPIAPAFSADGRWVYVLRAGAGPGGRLERFAVPEFGEPAEAAGDG